MKVYVVLMESGTIHSVHGSKSKAEATRSTLEKMYEKPVVKEFQVL